MMAITEVINHIAQHKALDELDILNQKSIDFIMDSSRKKSEDLHPKGIQEKTLSVVLDHLKSSGNKWLTGDEIAEKTGLTSVTVRRYMNYLVESGKAQGEINYETGGRPCILYKITE